MKKIIFGIFAHPDDEAFLPSGSFIKWVEAGAELHLICATRGERGQNPDKVAELGKVRQKEWRTAGKLMGATSQTQLGQPDGGLSNHLFHQIAAQVTDVIHKKLKSTTKPSAIDLVTYENCGVTGHLDHVAMSFITAYVYNKLRQQSAYSHHSWRLLYACACETIAPRSDTTFVFMPKGHEHCDIDITEDVSAVVAHKKEVMAAHHSQRADAKVIIERLGSNLAFEHFNVFKD